MFARTKTECPNWLLERPVAHRGLHSGACGPENSLPAFTAAAENGFPVELDVQMSSDGELVVFHDSNLERATGVAGSLSQKTLRDLKSLSLFGTKERVPLLKEVFSAVDGKVPILIEVKNEGRVGHLEHKIVAALKDYKGEVAIQSFNPLTVGWFRRNFSAVPTGLISGGFESRPDLSQLKKFVLSNVLLAPFEYPSFLSYELSALTIARKLLFVGLYKLPLIFWTIRNEYQANLAKNMGGNIIFENFLPIKESQQG